MKVAVVGCNGFGKVHLNVLQRVKGIEYYVFSRDEEKAKECMKDFNANGYFTDYDKILQSDVDVIDLLVSHDMHYTMGVQALRSGKHLMVEKPIAKSVEEGEKLIKTAKELNKKFMVLEQYYFDSSVRTAVQLLPKLGSLSLIIVRSTHAFRPAGWRREKDRMGGGALIDGGVHFIDVLLNIGGEYDQVKAQCGRYYSNIEGEDTSLATFRFKRGGLGLLIYSWATPAPPKNPGIEIYGTRGSIIEDPDTRAVDPDTRSRTKPFGDLLLNIEGKEERVTVEKTSPIEVEIRGFINAIEQDREVPMPPEVALRDLRAVYDIYNSCNNT